MKYAKIGVALALSTVAALSVSSLSSSARDTTVSGKMSTAETQDIINTLRSKGAFHKTLDGMSTAFDLDNQLKGKGPFTLFVAEDKAWAKINQADQDTLFNNKNKLKQVFEYQVLKDQKLDSAMLSKLTTVKSMEGQEIKVSVKRDDEKEKDDLYLDKARVKTADIQCTNGIIHIVDQPIMPTLVQ